jgi:hypothetical protein
LGWLESLDPLNCGADLFFSDTAGRFSFPMKHILGTASINARIPVGGLPGAVCSYNMGNNDAG